MVKAASWTGRHALDATTCGLVLIGEIAIWGQDFSPPTTYIKGRRGYISGTMPLLGI